MTEPTQAPAGGAVPEDLSPEAVLARFHGDAHAALVAALADLAALEQELTIAARLASYGYSRGRRLGPTECATSTPSADLPKS